MEYDAAIAATTEFLKRRFNVDDVALINPYVGCVEPSHVVAREVNVTRELHGTDLRLGDPGQRDQPRKPYKKLPYNLDDVSVRTLYIRYAKSGNDARVYRIYNPVSATEAANDAARIYAAMGVEHGCCLALKAGQEGPQSVTVLRENPNCVYLQAPFIKSIMHLDPQNLMNGIIGPVPPADLCLPNKGEYFVGEKELRFMDIVGYYLVPGDHVLSWCLQIPLMWRKIKGWVAIEYLVKPAGKETAHVLYYLVADQTFEYLRDQCIKNFLSNKVDRRPLREVGVAATAPVSITLSCSYICFPHMTPELKARLPPIIPKDFPAYWDVIRMENLAKQEAAEQEYLNQRAAEAAKAAAAAAAAASVVAEDTAESMDLSS